MKAFRECTLIHYLYQKQRDRTQSKAIKIEFQMKNSILKIIRNFRKRKRNKIVEKTANPQIHHNRMNIVLMIKVAIVSIQVIMKSLPVAVPITRNLILMRVKMRKANKANN